MQTNERKAAAAAKEQRKVLTDFAMTFLAKAAGEECLVLRDVKKGFTALRKDGISIRIEVCKGCIDSAAVADPGMISAFQEWVKPYGQHWDELPLKMKAKAEMRLQRITDILSDRMTAYKLTRITPGEEEFYIRLNRLADMVFGHYYEWEGIKR